MKKKSLLKSLYLLWLSPILFASCVSDVDLANFSKDIKIDESLVFPIGKDSLSIKDILTGLKLNNSFITDADTIKFLVSDSSEYTLKDKDFTASAQSISNSLYLSPNSNVTYPANTDIPSISSDETLDLGLNAPGGDRIDSIKVNSTTLTITISKTNLAILPSDVTLSLSSNSIRMANGTTLNQSYAVPSFGQPFQVTISNFVMKTATLSGIPLRVGLSFKKQSANLSVSTTSKLDVALNINQLAFKVAYGQFNLSSSSSQILQIPFDLSNYIPSGNIKFANPKIDIRLYSNIGTYLTFNIDNVKAYDKNNPANQVFAVFDNGTNSTTETIDKKPAVGQFIYKDFKQLNNVNGQTNLLFDSEKKYNILEYKFSLVNNNALINADPTPSFIIPNTSIKAKFKIDIPFYLDKGSEYTVRDTLFDVDKSIGSALKNISFNDSAKCILVLTVTNGVPLRATCSLNTLDTNGISTVLTMNGQDSVVIQAPEVYPVTDLNNSGAVKSTTPETIQIKLTGKEIEDMKKAKDIVINFKVDGKDKNGTLNQIRFSPKNFIKVKLGIFVNINGNYTF